ncbi:MAG: alpha/beta hydrolase, partial [Bacteriovoracia bacterium]
SYGGGVTWAAAAQRLPQIQNIVLLTPMPPFPMRYLKSPLYRGIMWVNSRLWRARLSHKFVTKFQYKTICKENLFNPRLLDTFYLDLGYLVLKQPHVADTLHQHSVGARMIDWQKWEDRLRDVNVPTLILQGKQDKLFSPESARYLASLIPNARLHEIDRCGHAMIFDHHREVIRQVSHWIEGSDA